MKEFPPHLDSRGCLIIPEQHEVIYPQYMIDLDRFWRQYHSRLTREHFETALAHVVTPQHVSVTTGYGAHKDAAHVVEFMYGWGTVFLSFIVKSSGETRVRFATEGIVRFDEDESRTAIWVFHDKLDESVFPIAPAQAQEAAQ